MPLIAILGRQRQVDLCEFKSNPIYILSSGKARNNSDILSQKKKRAKKGEGVGRKESKTTKSWGGTWFISTHKLQFIIEGNQSRNLEAGIRAETKEDFVYWVAFQRQLAFLYNLGLLSQG